MPGSQSAAPHRRLSVAMIACDCADMVAATLESVRNVADEIVVVDIGSRDRTREIALKGASRVLDFAWCDDFSAARNFCLEHTTGDWVFWLDAGESMSAEAGQQLRTLVDNQPDADRAYLVMVRAPAASHKMAAEQIGRIRLHPRRFGIEFTGRVREEIQTAIEALGMSIDLAPFAVTRGRREHEAELKRAKAERDVHLAAIEIQEHGVLPSPLLAMAEGCVALGHLSEGIEFFSRALQIAPRGSTFMLEGFYGVLAALDQMPSACDQQLALCQQALEVFPFDAQLLCAMGSYLQRQGRLDLASRSFETATRFGQIDPLTWHLVEIADVATVCHATCQDLLGDVDSARRTLEHAVEARPASERLRWQLLEFYIRHDCRREALELTGRMPDVPHREALRSAVRGACLAAKQNWISALAYLQTAFGSGCRDAICLRGLLTCHLATGDVAAAQRTLGEWQTLDPTNSEISRFQKQLAEQHAPSATSPMIGKERGEGTADGVRRLRLDGQSPGLAPAAPKTAPRTTVQHDADAMH